MFSSLLFPVTQWGLSERASIHNTLTVQTARLEAVLKTLPSSGNTRSVVWERYTLNMMADHFLQSATLSFCWYFKGCSKPGLGDASIVATNQIGLAAYRCLENKKNKV